LKNINVPKIKTGIYKNAGLSGHKTQQNANGHLVSNQTGVQKKTFEYLTNNMGNDSAVHAHTLDDKVRIEDKGLQNVDLSSKLAKKREKDDMLTDYFSAKKKFGR